MIAKEDWWSGKIALISAFGAERGRTTPAFDVNIAKSTATCLVFCVANFSDLFQLQNVLVLSP